MDWLKERTCDICGSNKWIAIDMDKEYLEVCEPCANKKITSSNTFNKIDCVNNFECPKCGCLTGKIEENKTKFGIRCSNCGNLIVMLIKQSNIKDATSNSPNINRSVLTCPKCGSENIAIGARGYRLWSGLIGSGKTVNRCGSCGYVWEPRKK